MLSWIPPKLKDSISIFNTWSGLQVKNAQIKKLPRRKRRSDDKANYQAATQPSARGSVAPTSVPSSVRRIISP
ncbi:MAG: hypothetical protein J6E31_08090, partial [Pyramidobacter sp.]|nr:hypothetical protein [Pyramidobacter sp.]